MNGFKHTLLTNLLLALVAPALAQVTPPKPAEPAPPAPPAPQDSVPPKPKKETRDEAHQRRMLEEQGAMKRRRAAIDAELLLHDRDHPFSEDWANKYAGEYNGGDGLGMNFTVKFAPESGFYFRQYGCTGTYDENHAEIIKADDSGLWLKPAIDPDLAWRSSVDERMHFIDWGSRRYLIARKRMLDFCKCWNEKFSERNLGARFPWMTRSGEFDAGESPQLPAEFERFLHLTPLDCEITNVLEVRTRASDLEGKSHITTAIIDVNVGDAEGVYEELKLQLADRSLDVTIEVRSVREHAATCQMQLYTSNGAKPLSPEKGWHLRTASAQ
ncbi:MAG: hypothetical protein IT432_08340 [Phycisphaerales bacterium]|nr:hypothetical protein [Phycisphaerales bacterium]